MKSENASAYGGDGWRQRTGRLDEESSSWSSCRVDSEFAKLKAVLLYKPGRELALIRDPNTVQHLGRIDPDRIAREFDALAALYRSLGIQVHFIDPKSFRRPLRHFNLMYARDLFVNTRGGAVVARMGSEVRAGEEKYAALALAKLAVPIGRTIAGSGTFEGADALWLNRDTVLCGIGARTNLEAFRQLEQFLVLQGVTCLPVPIPRGVQHLMGMLQLVDQDLALVRIRKAPKALLGLLKQKGIRVVAVGETDEVVHRQGMNVVAVAPRTIVMPARCPGLRKAYENAGLEIAGFISISELTRGAGGIACATGILARAMPPRGAVL